MRSRRTLLTGLAAAVAVLGVVAPGAGAHAVMAIDGATIVYNGSDDISLNRLEVSIVGTNVRFFDPGSDGGIQPAEGCSPGQTDSSGFIVEVLCPRAGRTALRIDLGEGQDTANVNTPLNATVVGGRGADTITGGSGNDALNGGDANDVLTGAGGNDTLLGEAGDDRLAGGDGNDVLQAAVGIDAVDAGAGDDDLRVRDGVTDTSVACGLGNDKAQADAGDPLTDCESVDTGNGFQSTGASPTTAAPPSTAPPGTGPGATGGGTAGGGTGSGSGSGTGTTGGGNGGSTSTASDTTPPRVRSGGSTLQRLSSTNRLTVLATSSEAAEVLAAGTITVGERRIVLTTARREVDVAGGGALLRLTVPKSGMKAIRTALSKRRKVRAVITVVATDRAGNSSASKLPSVTLRR